MAQLGHVLRSEGAFEDGLPQMVPISAESFKYFAEPAGAALRTDCDVVADDKTSAHELPRRLLDIRQNDSWTVGDFLAFQN